MHARAALARAARTHGLSLLLFGALTVGWTWPLILHLADALPGDPGDNYSYVWNLWWMRQALSTPGLTFFRTTYLFYPFGTTLVDHSHSALPAFIAATLLRSLTPVMAQNVLVLAFCFMNLAAMYALAWSVTERAAPSVLAAVVFGLSPYLAVHMLGHFDLIAAWPLPLYALALRRAVVRPGGAASVTAGVVLGGTAYVASYYAVYLGLLTAIYLAAAFGLATATRWPAPPSRAVRVLGRVSMVIAAVTAAAAGVVLVSGGRTFTIGARQISAHAPQNALTVMWIALAIRAAAAWRPRVRIDLASPAARRAGSILWRVGVASLLVASPLAWKAAQLVAHGEYVTPRYGWRSIPHGIDAAAPLLGHPLHPLFGALSRRGYAALHQSYIEVIGWFGVVPVALLLATRTRSASFSEVRAWRAVGLVFAIWSLGPFLTIGGFDTGLKLPAILLRFVPFVANARIPGRAVVVVFMAAAMLIAIGLSAGGSGAEPSSFAASTGGLERSRLPSRLQSPLVCSLLIGVVAFEYWDAPIRLTPLEYPAVYHSLANAEPGAVCEVPLGIGDGLSTGVGSQTRRVLFYATQHGHPLVGGYVARMPADAVARYRQMPVAGTLLALSNGEPLPGSDDLPRTAAARPEGLSRNGSAEERNGNPQQQTNAGPCRYLVVHRDASSPALLEYVRRLGPELVSASGTDGLYRLH